MIICGSIISSSVLDFDKKAKVEFELTKSRLEQYILANNQQINIEQFAQTLDTQSSDEPRSYAKISRIFPNRK